MGEKVFLFNNSNKKITTNEKIRKNSGAPSTTPTRGVWGVFQVIYLSNLVRLFCIVLTLVSPQTVSNLVCYMSNRFL